MIEATVAMVVMAGLFVVFGTLRLADRGGCEGGCAGCAHEAGSAPQAGCGPERGCALEAGPVHDVGRPDEYDFHSERRSS